MRRSRLSAALTLCGLLSFATSAHTEEPKGFQEWPWGTPQGTLIEKFLRMKCRDYLLFNEEGPLKGSLSCDGYQIGDVPLYVLFYFEPSESLAGYWFRFESHYRDMRQTILDKLGKPSSITARQYRTALGRSITGEEMIWQWPSGTAARLSERCPESSDKVMVGSSCLQVTTKPLHQRYQRQEREREQQRKKGF